MPTRKHPDRPAVLVIEDNPITRAMVRSTLEKHGFRVLEAEDGAESLRRVASERPELVLQDLNLPDMDGLELTRHLRHELGSSLPIIAFSSATERLEQARASRLGYSDYLTKPVDGAHLVTVLRGYLAAASATPARGGEGSAEDAHRLPVRETVLVVEDDHVIRPLLCMTLRKSGYQVIEAGDGAEALRVCKQHEGPIHLLITDTVIPGISGPEAARRSLELRPDMKLLVISGYLDDVISRRYGLEPGSASFLQKPFRMEVLAHRVRQLLDAPA